MGIMRVNGTCFREGNPRRLDSRFLMPMLIPVAAGCFPGQCTNYKIALLPLASTVLQNHCLYGCPGLGQLHGKFAYIGTFVQVHIIASVGIRAPDINMHAEGQRFADLVTILA